MAVAAVAAEETPLAAGRALHLACPHLPPSDNHIRIHRRQGGEAYSKEAEAYRTTFVAHMKQAYFIEIQRFVRGHAPTSAYRLTLFFIFPSLVTKGWLEMDRQGKRKAKSPYKMFDGGNRRKLIEDCLASALGIDDSLTFELTIVKRMAPEDPHVEIFLEEVDPCAYGVPSEYTTGLCVLP